MRTTLALDDRLLAAAKARASSKGQTLGQFVEDAVRSSLVEPSAAVTDRVIPVFMGGTGMRSAIDPTSNRSLYDALDASGDLG